MQRRVPYSISDEVAVARRERLTSPVTLRSIAAPCCDASRRATAPIVLTIRRGTAGSALVQLSDESLQRGHLDGKLCVLGLHSVDVVVQSLDLAGGRIRQSEVIERGSQGTDIL